ncbi:MAG: tetratricopeptide repeat protein [Acidobacteriaceae bacterium]|jgi:predicted negative regulator of RcsB-dependent stress response|nr:tetratricopeptide repeat protein [Acidobacteriaceae bacterium]
MKRTERHHLKENELGHLAMGARDFVQGQGRSVGLLVTGVLVVLIAVLGYVGWSNHVQGQAHALLADAMALDDAAVGPPPAPGSPAPAGVHFATVDERNQASQQKFKAVADQYPSSEAGIFARYREAGMWMALRNPSNAASAFEQVIEKAGSSSLYGQLARLGLAEAQAQSGQLDPAVSTMMEMAQHKDGPVPVDGILLRLAHIYLDAGKTTDAQQTFTRLVSEYPNSPFAPDARRELSTLKKPS